MKVLQARLGFTLGTTKIFLCLKVYPAALCNGGSKKRGLWFFKRGIA